jgi:hypothetical protein
MFYTLQFTMTRQLARVTNPVMATANLLSFLQSNPGLRNAIISGARSLYDAGSALSFPASGATPQTQLRLSNGGRSQRRPKSRRNRTTKSARQNGPQSSPAHSLDMRPRVTVTFAVPLTTITTTGIVNQALWLGYADTTSASVYSLSGISTSQYTNLAAVFHWQEFHSVKVCYEPLAAYTTSGWVGIVTVPDPTITPSSGILTTIQAYKERPYSAAGDVKMRQEAELWIPRDEEEREAKQVTAATGITGGVRRNYGVGYVCFSANTNATSAATLVGHVMVTCDITFHGLI